MSTLKEDLTAIKEIQDGLVSNKVARFSYTQKAYTDNIVDGVDTYNVNNEQNIPNGTAAIMKVNDTIINKGYRAQASSITRMLMNHFLGRISYNLNKINDNMQSLLDTLITKFPTSLPANGGMADTATTATTATTANTASKVANSLAFGSKTYNGSTAKKITANDLGLLVPDLTNKITVDIVMQVPNGLVPNPFTVPTDGWILSFKALADKDNYYALIDNVGDLHLTPSQKRETVLGSSNSVLYSSLNCPYPVKKGQLITASKMTTAVVTITFAPCLNN